MNKPSNLRENGKNNFVGVIFKPIVGFEPFANPIEQSIKIKNKKDKDNCVTLPFIDKTNNCGNGSMDHYIKGTKKMALKDHVIPRISKNQLQSKKVTFKNRSKP